MKKDLIFVFFGGSMEGVFGAGVVTSLQKFNIYERIHSIYAISAGAHNVAYFLAKDTKFGSRIYYEDLLVSNRFIKNTKSKFLYELFLSLINKKTKIEKFIDIDYLINVEKHSKKLNIENVSKSDIPFFIRLFNVEKGEEEYLDGKTDILKKLKATAAAVPFYPKKIKINENMYCDGDTLSRIIDSDLEKLINDNPDKKIFLVFNNPKGNRFSFEAFTENFIWTILLLIFFRKKYVFKKLNFFKEKRKLEKYSKLENVITIEPDFDFFVFCTKKDKVIKLYKDGISKTEKVIKKVLNI